jgi:hypothetical protein
MNVPIPGNRRLHIEFHLIRQRETAAEPNDTQLERLAALAARRDRERWELSSHSQIRVF